MMPIAIFKDQWENGGIMTIPFIETVNTQTDVNQMPDKWGSAYDQPTDRSDVTLGSHPEVELTGTMIIGIFAKSGLGAEVLDQHIQEVRDCFQGYAKNGLEIRQVDGPHDISPMADGMWWRLAFTATYVYWEKRDAIGPGFGDWIGFPAEN
jgi:hypothetical protein